MNKLPFIVLAAVVLVGLAAFLVSSSSRSPLSPPSSLPTTTTPQNQNNQTEAGVREITVEGSEFSFSPTRINLITGEKVKLVFKNTGATPHNLTLDQLGIATKTISPGASDSIEFTATRTGTFNFYCSVANHRQLGMEGQLEVE